MNKLKMKKHMIMLIDAENQHLFMMKILIKRASTQNLQLTSHLKLKDLNAFPQGQNIRLSILTLQFNIVSHGIARQ